MKRVYLFSPTVFCALVLLAPTWAQEAKQAAKFVGTHEVETVSDLAYYDGKDADAVRHKLDLYLPKGQKDFPVLMFVHGGAWRSGTKDLYAPLGKVFAKNGIGTVIINYRLTKKAKEKGKTPEVQHPAHIEDVARAFAWVQRNIAKYGGKPDQIFISGHSAGGHLVALLGTDQRYLKAHKLTISNIKGVMPLSGPYDIQLSGPFFQDVFGTDKDGWKSASPLAHVNGQHPPMLIIYADKDYATLDSMAEQFCAALKKCDCDAGIMKIANRDHISIIRQVANETDVTTQAMLGFIAKHSGLKLK